MDKTLKTIFGILCVSQVSILGQAAQTLSLPPKGTPAPTVTPTNSTSSAGQGPLSMPMTPAPAYQLYTYYGDRYRDPFIPLTGEYREQGTDRPPQIASLILKGIVQDEKGRIALLTSGVSSYILRGGRLYDGRNHLMKGISGIIKTNSVVLMGSDRTVKELKVNPTL
jgi:hypothetical protein